MFILRVLVASACVAAPVTAWSQAQPDVNPVGVVSTALGSARPLLTHTRRHRVDTPYEQTVRATLTQGQCYEVLGYASGASPVFAQVMEGRARVGDSVPMTNSVGRVARQRFCAREPGELYSLQVRTEGAAWWYVAVVPAEGSAPSTAGMGSSGARVNPAAAPITRITLEQHAFGDGVPDYITRQVELFARQRAGLTGMTRTARRVLPTNGVYEAPLVIPSGRCVNIVAVGVPSVADLVVELEDPSGHRVAQDATRRGTENIRYCAPYAGTFRMRVRVFSGAGLVGVQALVEP